MSATHLAQDYCFFADVHQLVPEVIGFVLPFLVLVVCKACWLTSLELSESLEELEHWP
jgi:hypothetical protein